MPASSTGETRTYFSRKCIGRVRVFIYHRDCAVEQVLLCLSVLLGKRYIMSTGNEPRDNNVATVQAADAYRQRVTKATVTAEVQGPSPLAGPLTVPTFSLLPLKF